MANYNYISIDVVDTAVLCNLDIKQSTINREEVQARCPYCGDYKYRMYLSHRVDNATFWCHNCGTTGNAVTLYADFNPEGRRLTTPRHITSCSVIRMFAAMKSRILQVITEPYR